MNAMLQTIQVDERTAAVLRERAAARGLSVAELVAELAWMHEDLPPDLQAMCATGEGPWSPQALAEDRRVLADFERIREGVPFDEVKAWMNSWGGPNELPTPKLRKL